MAQEVEAMHRRAKEQAMLVDVNFMFREGLKLLVDKLVNKVPFDKIEAEYMAKNKAEKTEIPGIPPRGDAKAQGLNDESARTTQRSKNNAFEGMMHDSDYVYCYQNLLVETNEWRQTMSRLAAYLRGEKPRVAIPKYKKKPKPAVSPETKPNGEVTEKKKKKKEAEVVVQKPRLTELKKTVNVKTKF